MVALKVRLGLVLVVLALVVLVSASAVARVSLGVSSGLRGLIVTPAPVPYLSYLIKVFGLLQVVGKPLL